MNILNKRNRGFTIIELLIVLAILAGVVVMLARGVSGGSEAAKIKQAKIDMEGRMRNEIILAVIKNQGKMPATFVIKDSKDPWGEDYAITSAGSVVKVAPGAKAKAANVGAVTIDVSEYLE